MRPDNKDAEDHEFHPIVRNFRDALTDPENTSEPPSTAETRPPSHVQEAVVRALSGGYARNANRLRGLLREPMEHRPRAKRTRS
jgi:hypothetical protein